MIESSTLTWENSLLNVDRIAIIIPIGGNVEEAQSAQGFTEQRSYVEIKENAKLDVQIGVKVYAEDDQHIMNEAADIAVKTYLRIRKKFNDGLPGVSEK